MKRVTAVIMLLFLVAGTATALFAQQPIVISPGSGIVDVSGRSLTYLDLSSQLTAQDILSGRYDTSFKPQKEPFINSGITRGASWCRFRIANTSLEKLYLSVIFPNHDSISLYKVVNHTPLLIGTGSRYFPIEAKQVKTESFMFNLQLTRDTAEYLLRVKKYQELVYLVKAGYTEDFIEDTNRMNLWNGTYLGFILLMVLYNFFLFLSLRDRAYLYYVCYITCMGLFNMVMNGTAFLYLWPGHNYLSNYGLLPAILSGVFSVPFTLHFLHMRSYAPILYKVLIGMGLFCFCGFIIALLGYWDLAFMLVQVFVFLGLTTEITAGVVILRKGYKPARFFLIAWGALALSVFFFILTMYKFFSFAHIAQYSMQVGSAVEALLLSFALADRFNTYRKEKEDLILSQNEMLEYKVAERTAELNKEKQESESLLLNILPYEVAAELKSTGTAKTKLYESITVLFTDFKDFTIIGEQMSAEKLVSELNYCFSAFDKIIQRYGVEKIKTIGDSYMCAGGLSERSGANAVDVVNAGIEMRDFMHAYNKDKISKGELQFEVRVGIHTGPVVAGIVGIKKFAYDIWGDTVNVASRMETGGEVDKVNISGTTYELVKKYFNCTYRGKIEARNKGKIDMYFVEEIP